MSFTLLPDKSTIQMLSEREAYWMKHFFYVLIAPVLMTETLGNLRKEWKDERDPKPFLASLARKIKGMHAYHSIDSDQILRVELSGQFVPMDGRPLVGGAQEIVDSTGAKGFFFDVAPEDEALDRWRTQEFSAEEAKLAELWRAGLSELRGCVRTAS